MPRKTPSALLRPVRADVIRDERFKYVHFASLPPLLFDLTADPIEMKDLAGDPAHMP